MKKCKMKVMYPRIGLEAKTLYSGETKVYLPYDQDEIRWTYPCKHPFSYELLKLIQGGNLDLAYLVPAPVKSYSTSLFQGRVLRRAFEMPVGVYVEVIRAISIRRFYEGQHMIGVTETYKGKSINDEEFDDLMYKHFTPKDKQQIDDNLNSGSLYLPDQYKDIRIYKSFNLRTLIEEDESFSWQSKEKNLFRKCLNYCKSIGKHIKE